MIVLLGKNKEDKKWKTLYKAESFEELENLSATQIKSLCENVDSISVVKSQYLKEGLISDGAYADIPAEFETKFTNKLMGIED